MRNLEMEAHVFHERRFAKDVWLGSPVRSSFMSVLRVSMREWLHSVVENQDLSLNLL